MPVHVHAIQAGRRALADYAPIAGEEAVERVLALAGELRDLRVLHLSPARPPGPAPALLRAQLALMHDAGLRAEWRVVDGPGALARVGAQLADGLRGGETAIEPADWAEHRGAWAGAVEGAGEWDVVVAHDAAGVAAAGARGAARLVWRLHRDASAPDARAWERVRALAGAFDLWTVPAARLAPPGEPRPPIAEVAVAVDPFCARSRELPVRLAGDALRALGIDLERPLACQLGALDPWSDAHEALAAFRLAREELPELQLALAPGEGDGAAVAGELADYAAGVPDVHVLGRWAGAGELELNALTRLARVALVATLAPDAGQGAAEALWARTPVVAAPDGPAAELARGCGRVVAGAQELAGALAELVSDPALGIELGARGRARACERHLALHALEGELAALRDLVGGGSQAGDAAAGGDATVKP